MPAIDPRILSELVAEVHTNLLMKRSIDHRALETIAVGKSIVLSPRTRNKPTYLAY